MSRSSYGFGLPKSFWDTPVPSKKRLSKRRSSHLESPLRAIKRRRLSPSIPSQRRIEKHDGGFTYWWIIDSPTTKQSQDDSSRNENPLKELSRSEWKQRSVQRAPLDSHSEVLDVGSPQHSKSLDSLSVPVARPVESLNAVQSDSSDASTGQEKCTVLPAANDKVMPSPAPNTSKRSKEHGLVSSLARARRKRRKRDYSPSQIVLREGKKFIKRHRTRTEKHTEKQMIRVKKPKKPRKKKTRKVKTLTYPGGDFAVPEFPLLVLSKPFFACHRDEPRDAVAAFWMDLCESWKKPLLDTYGPVEETNQFGFITRCCIECSEHLKQKIPEIVDLCQIVLEKNTRVKPTEKPKGVEERYSLSDTWYTDNLKSRSANLNAYCDALEKEIKGFDDMYALVKQPGFIERLFPQLKLEVDFENSVVDEAEDEEDPILKEWELNEQMAAMEIEFSAKVIELESRIERKENEVEDREAQVRALRNRVEASSASVTTLKDERRKMDVHSGNKESHESQLRQGGHEFVQNDFGVVSCYLQALERAQGSQDMDVDE